MRKLVFIFAVLISALWIGNASAQSSTLLNTESVLIVKGKIFDANTNDPIGYGQINFDKFGDELILADLDDQGNYILAFDKSQMSFPMRMKFKIEGYEKHVCKKINTKEEYIQIDVPLFPESLAQETTSNKVKWESNATVSTTALYFE